MRVGLQQVAADEFGFRKAIGSNQTLDESQANRIAQIVRAEQAEQGPQLTDTTDGDGAVDSLL